MQRTMAGLLAAACILAAPLLAHAGVTVFAAVSTADALADVGALYRERGGGEVVFVHAASAALARQIENGAPADIFLSADERWMNELASHGLLVAGSRRDLLGNSLVLVAPAPAHAGPVDISPSTDWLGLLDGGRLAMGDPASVPVGTYAREALQRLGAWAALQGRAAFADSARSTLAFVERGEAPLGIVYSTDARLSPKVAVVGTFPSQATSPVAYPVALVAGHDGREARAFLDFLQGSEAAGVFRRYGFTVK